MMPGFTISSEPIVPDQVKAEVLDPHAGGFCSFEGWVRNHHQGKPVERLFYEAYASLSEKEGLRIIDEAHAKFSIVRAVAVHRVGEVNVSQLAVVVCVSAVHRDAAFEACRYIIDQVKARVPIWKKEYFTDGTNGWVRCDHCAQHS